jgi:hypothetical protein
LYWSCSEVRAERTPIARGREPSSLLEARFSALRGLTLERELGIVLSSKLYARLSSIIQVSLPIESGIVPEMDLYGREIEERCPSAENPTPGREVYGLLRGSQGSAHPAFAPTSEDL